jgi:hypothetical protein
LWADLVAQAVAEASTTSEQVAQATRLQLHRRKGTLVENQT